MPAKCLHPFGVFGASNFNMASILFLNGLMHTFLSFINMMFSIYCNSILNNWHFFGDILSPFFNKTFHKSSNFAMCAFFVGVKSSRLSMIALQCFLVSKQSTIAFIYDCQIEGDMFKPLGIL